MKIIIKTGFEQITHNVQFHPNSQPKGESLVKSGHVRDVHEYREGGASYLIDSRIIRQTSVTSPPYNTKLFIDDGRFVINVLCTCVYNKSKACKHIAALFHYINNKESRSKTDVEQQWGGLTAQQFAKQKYSKGRYFYEMFPPEPELDICPQDIDLAELKASSALKLMISAAEERKNSRSSMHEQKLINARLREAESIMEKEKLEDCLTFLFKLFDQKTTQHILPIVPKEQQDFYNRYIVLSQKEIVELCWSTIKQSENAEWYKPRRYRISASKSAHSVKSRKTKTIDKLIGEMLHPQKVENSATKYGKTMEPIARKEYESITGTSVQQVGVIVCKSKPWLCASLDGVVVKESQAIKVVEIKCPASCEEALIIDSDSGKPNVSYLKIENNKPILKSSSIIYTQYQIQMYVSGLSECDLFVYSPLISYIIPVLRNDKFLQDTLSKCEDFYFNHYLPAVQICVENERATSFKKSGIRKFTGKDVSNNILLSLGNNQSLIQ